MENQADNATALPFELLLSANSLFRGALFSRGFSRGLSRGCNKSVKQVIMSWPVEVLLRFYCCVSNQTLAGPVSG